MNTDCSLSCRWWDRCLCGFLGPHQSSAVHQEWTSNGSNRHQGQQQGHLPQPGVCGHGPHCQGHLAPLKATAPSQIHKGKSNVECFVVVYWEHLWVSLIPITTIFDIIWFNGKCEWPTVLHFFLLFYLFVIIIIYLFYYYIYIYIFFFFFGGGDSTYPLSMTSNSPTTGVQGPLTGFRCSVMLS